MHVIIADCRPETGHAVHLQRETYRESLIHFAVDMGRFRAPTLRNIAVTAPYMHDGSIASLAEVIDHYASGGIQSPVKSPRLRGFAITDAERNDVIAFLNSLTDQEFLSNPALSGPEK